MLIVRMDPTGHTMGWKRSQTPVIPCLSNKTFADGEYDYGLKLKPWTKKVVTQRGRTYEKYKRFVLSQSDTTIWIVTQDLITPWNSPNHGYYGSANSNVFAYRPDYTDFVIYELKEGGAFVSNKEVIRNSGGTLLKLSLNDASVSDWETWGSLHYGMISAYALRTKPKSTK